MGQDALNNFSRFQAARRGQLAEYDASSARDALIPLLTQAQQYKNAGLLSQGLQAPEDRAAMLAQGPQGPVAKAYGLMGPRIPDNAQVQTLQAAGNLDPIEQAQIDRWRANGIQPGLPGDVPPVVTTDKSAERDLRAAQTDALKGAGTADPTARPPGIPADWTLQQTISVPGKPAHYTWAPPVQGVQTLPAGTLKGPGQQFQGGEVVGDKQVALTPGAGGGTTNVATQLKNVHAAFTNLATLLVPQKLSDGRSVRSVDIFPDFSQGGEGASVMGIPVPNAVGRTVGGHMGIPFAPEGYTTGQAYLDNIRNDKQNPLAPLAQNVATMRGTVGDIVRGLGESSRVAQQELNRVLDAFIPAVGDSPGPGGSAEQKVKNGLGALQRIENALKSGTVTTPAQLRDALSSYLVSQGGTPLAAEPGTTPEQDNAPFSAASVPSGPTARAGGAAPTGRTAYDPAAVADALKRLNGGQ